MTPRVIVVDNYDSFVYTQVGYLRELGADVDVARNDAVAAADLTGYDGVLLSPGPGRPETAGVCVPAVSHCARHRIPLLGVCLGHQAVAQAYGATVTHAPELLHGKTSLVEHEGEGLLSGLASPFTGTRYHSLAVVEDTLPSVLQVTARTPGGVVMALQALDAPIHGVQFHPESVLTEGGYRLLANWLETCGDESAPARAEAMTPHVTASAGTGALVR